MRSTGRQPGTEEPEMTTATQDCEAQLAQVQTRLAECLKAREQCRTQASWRLVNQRLHGLYMLEYDIKQDLARCQAAA